MSRLYSWSNWSTNATGSPGRSNRPAIHSFQPVTITNGGSSSSARVHCSAKFSPPAIAPGELSCLPS